MHGTLNTSTFTQTGGTTTVESGGTMGGSGAVVNVSGGNLQGAGTLQGAGRATINGAVTVSGNATITPGSLSGGIPGTLTINGTYAQTGGTFNELIGSTSNYGVLNVNGAAALSSSNAALNITLASGFTPVVGDTFQILDSTGLTGSFAHLGTFELDNYNWSLTYQNNDAVLSIVSAVSGATNRASPVINNSPISLGNVRVGSTSPTAYVSVTNQATTSPQAALNASISGNGLITASGSFNLLAPGSTNSNTLQVGMNTGTAGAINGRATIALVSDASNIGGCAPNCQLTLASQNVTVTGGVYLQAQPTTLPTTVALGNYHVGAGPVSHVVGITNTSLAPVGYQEGLDVTAGATSTGVTLGGGATNLAAGISTNLTVGLTGTQAGNVTGTATVGLASDGTIDGLSNLTLTSQTMNVTGTGYNLAAGNTTPSPITIANQRIGGANTQVLTVTNAAPLGSYTEGLDASFGTNGGSATNNGGAISLLGGGASNAAAMSVGVDTVSAGAKNGSVTLNYVSDGSGSSGLGTTSLGSQVINVSGNVYLEASGNASSPVQVANQRIGGSNTAVVTVANSATGPAGYVEDLNVSVGSSGAQATGSGSISNILAGTNSAATGTGAILASVDTSSAGAKSGTVTLTYQTAGAVNGVSNGLGVAGVGSQGVTVTGNVYQAAVGQLNTAPLNVGIVHVGDTVQQTLSISNIASGPAGFVEDLNSSFGSSSGTGAGAISGAGALNGITAGKGSAGANGTMTVNVNTSAAETINGAIGI
ncbi:MAG: choice-of-anchor D domain-containing protein, partial [Mycobacterium sp.]|nr:choice-of-anchor D domain-containing protein [Mycobacterium sp.]